MKMKYIHGVFCLFISWFIAPSSSRYCSPLWTSIEGLENRYRFSHFNGNFLQAKAFCSGIGGYVVNVTSETEYEGIRSEIHSRRFGSTWVSRNARPEFFSMNWRQIYAPHEPNHSGLCLYLSSSQDLRWRDTSCMRDKRVLCERHDCQVQDTTTDLSGENEVDVTKTSTPESCLTVDNVPCILPFKYEGKTYYKCTAEGDFNAREWCSTRTDEYGQHLEGTDWGYCRRNAECMYTLK